jgi:hypothetical protein
MLENAGVIIGERTMQWDMGRLYPGLMLRVGPSIGANGVLEFVMDSTQDRDDRTFFVEEPSTGEYINSIEAFKFIFIFSFTFYSSFGFFFQ